ncbi:glycosyl hydrolase family 43 [Hymenobacter qilianensis]|uniref:Glycosyl hydrolase family 43 n=1 Tax=Hymenobacter qilianensis TaxID=1385715 RepID=A0ACB5PQA3_9BACT|nr:glycoside hydrolase family 43 protein [Hymenobacter qilianensis]GGF61048.1 glycosyl hydrolase family 43 [Hymenobacter qilianensis]
MLLKPVLRKLLTLSLIVSLGGCKKSENSTVAPPPLVVDETTYSTPLLASAPDPWVYQKDGFYYFMSTTGGNLSLRKTAKMSELSKAPAKVIWTPPPGNTYRDIWAPEIYFFDGKWYVYFSADPFCCNGHRVFVLENSSPDPTTGTWVDKGRIANPTEDFWAIDGTVMEQNGQRYFLWSGHRETADGVQRLYISKMSNPWTLTGPRVELSSPEYEWEKKGEPDVNEGPEVLKHGNKTFIVYSASHCSTDDYALGLLSASQTADPLDPKSWTKTPTPVFVKNPTGNAFGPGHNGFFQSPDGKEDWLIYHANVATGQGCGDARSTRMQKFSWNADGTPNFGQPVPTGSKLPRPSGE